jgi:hypothetical protein
VWRNLIKHRLAAKETIDLKFRAVIHRDYKQEEPRIPAFQSDDREPLGACDSGDRYLAMADQLVSRHPGPRETRSRESTVRSSSDLKRTDSVKADRLARCDRGT